MHDTKTAYHVPTNEWWAAKRWRYNLILLLAAPISFISLLIIWWFFETRLPCLEITLFSIVGGGCLFLIGLVLANICYFLGPLFEKLVKPNNVNSFRKFVFAMGTGFSLLLIFSPVIGSLIAAILDSSVREHCEAD